MVLPEHFPTVIITIKFCDPVDFIIFTLFDETWERFLVVYAFGADVDKFNQSFWNLVRQFYKHVDDHDSQPG